MITATCSDAVNTMGIYQSEKETGTEVGLPYIRLKDADSRP